VKNQAPQIGQDAMFLHNTGALEQWDGNEVPRSLPSSKISSKKVSPWKFMIVQHVV
jgi:hypothetical protein